MVTGTSMAYVAGGQGGHRPIPLATDGVRRGTHAPPAKPKPTGLDWDALTPTCTSCGTKSGQVASVEGRGNLCPTCRGAKPTKTKTKEQDRKVHRGELPEDELLRRFTGPDDTQLGRELADLEATDPKVAESARTLEHAVDQALRPDDHVVPEHLEADRKTPEDETPAHEEEMAAAAGPQEATPEHEDHTPAYLRRLQAARAQTHDPVEDPEAPDLDQATVTAWSAKDQLDDVEREIPEIVEAPAAYDELLDNIRHPAEQPTAPEPKPDPIPAALAAANVDAQTQHAARVLRDTAGSSDPVARLLRLNVLSAVESLYIYTQLHPETPAPATSTPPARDTTSPEPDSDGLGGGRPAADAEGEAARQPATRQRKSRLDPVRDELIKAYTDDGTSPTALGAKYGVSDVTIRLYLQRHGVQLRTRSEAQKNLRKNNPTGDTTA